MRNKKVFSGEERTLQEERPAGAKVRSGRAQLESDKGPWQGLEIVVTPRREEG